MLFAIICTDRPASLDLRHGDPAVALRLSAATRPAGRARRRRCWTPEGKPVRQPAADRGRGPRRGRGLRRRRPLCQGRAVREHADPPVPRRASRTAQDRALMAYWLVKSEPDAFGWDQQVARGVEPWTGVRNHAGEEQPEGHALRRPRVLLPFQRRQGGGRRGGGGARGLSRPHRGGRRLGVRRHARGRRRCRGR